MLENMARTGYTPVSCLIVIFILLRVDHAGEYGADRIYAGFVSYRNIYIAQGWPCWRIWRGPDIRRSTGCSRAHWHRQEISLFIDNTIFIYLQSGFRIRIHKTFGDMDTDPVAKPTHIIMGKSFSFSKNNAFLNILFLSKPKLAINKKDKCIMRRI